MKMEVQTLKSLKMNLFILIETQLENQQLINKLKFDKLTHFLLKKSIDVDVVKY